MITKIEIANLLDEIADMMEFKGENKFKVKAYRNGASVIRNLKGDLQELAEKRKLDRIKGIGPGLQKVIYEYTDKKESSLYKDLKAEIPDGIEMLLKIRGLNSRRIRQIHSQLGISTVAQLEDAAKNNQLLMVKGLGEAVQNKILEGIHKYRQNNRLIRIDEAERIVNEMLERTGRLSSVKMSSSTGDFRRGREIFSDVEIIILAENKDLVKIELKEEFEYPVENDKLILNENFSVPAIIHITYSRDEYYKKLFITTGSEAFIRTLNINFDRLKPKSEEDIFSKIKLPYFIPELREKEIFEKGNNKNHDNSTLHLDDFKGLIHFHSAYSDGRNKLNEMTEAAQICGFKFGVVTDHSKSAYYAKGLDENRLQEQLQEIKKINRSKKFFLLQGIESDILQSGELDYSPDILKSFAFIIASIHSRFNMNETEMTGRMIKAIENPYTDLLAHPSGRMLLHRDPYDYNVRKVIDACAANNVAIEINSNPRRLDLDWRWIPYAREKGCLFAVNTDAHSINEISFIKYGLTMARKGGLQSREVINCFDLKSFRKFMNRKIQRIF